MKKHSSLTIIPLLFIATALAGCASKDDYINQYKKHPGARVACAHFIGESAKLTKNIDGDINISSTSNAEIESKRDDRGSIYHACIENWAIEKSKEKSNDVNRCAAGLSSTIVLAPAAFFCKPLAGDG